MGDSSRAQTSVTTQTPEWHSSAAQGYLGRAGELMSQPYTPYTGPEVADLSPVTTGSIQGLWDMANGHPMGDDAVDMTRRTLQGGYQDPFAVRNQFSGQSPQFQSVLQSGLRDLGDAYKTTTASDTNDMFALSGAYGGSAHQTAVKNNQDVLAKRMGDFSSGMLNDQYNRSAGLEESYLGRGSAGHQAERGRQMGAVGAATGLLDTHSNNLMRSLQAGDIERQQQQRLYDAQRSGFNEWRDYDQNQLDRFGNAISRSVGGAGSTQTQTGPGSDPVQQGMGTMMFADMIGKSKSKP